MNRDMARERIVLEPFEHGQARLVGQADIEQDAVRLQVAGEFHALCRGGRVHEVEFEFMREVVQDVRETQVVFNRQDHAVRALAVGAVVGNGLRRRVSSHSARARTTVRERRGSRCHCHEVRGRVALHDGGASRRPSGHAIRRAVHHGSLRLAHMPDHIELRRDRAFTNGSAAA